MMPNTRATDSQLQEVQHQRREEDLLSQLIAGLLWLSFCGVLLAGAVAVPRLVTSVRDDARDIGLLDKVRDIVEEVRDIRLDDVDKELRRVVNTIDLKSQSDKTYRLDSIRVEHRKVTFTVTVSLRSVGSTKAQWREAMKATTTESAKYYHNPNTDYFKEITVWRDEDGSYIGETSEKIFLRDGQDISTIIPPYLR